MGKDISQRKKKIEGVYRQFDQKNDVIRKEQLLKFYEKYEQDKWILAFCGHFSAGKSTMINSWWGSDVLPTSPIPTSGNVVSIQSGNDQIRLWYKDGTGAFYHEAYSKEKHESLAWDSDEIERMDIYSSETILPHKMILLDTPGVDSNDEAHKAATMKALHLSDCIVYVMDYNHVQSEGNFTFVQELQKKGKDLVLIVNQIDKHTEEELTLEQFKQSVYESFANWGINEVPIFFTSLKKGYNKENDFQIVRELIENKFAQYNSETALNNHLTFSIKEHVEELQKELEVKAEELELTNQEKIIKKEYDTLLQKDTYIKEGALLELQKILENALFITYETREKCHTFLTAHTKGYKTGLFSLFSKSTEEKEKQQTTIVQAMREALEMSVLSHTRSLQKELDEICEITGQHSFHNEFLTVDWLLSAWKPGAVITNESVINYTNDLKGQMIREMKRQFTVMISSYEAVWDVSFNEKQKELTDEMGKINKILYEQKEIEEEIAQLKAYEEELLLLIETNEEEYEHCEVQAAYERQQQFFGQNKLKSVVFRQNESKKKEEVKVTKIQQENSVYSLPILKEGAAQLEKLPLLTHYKDEINKKIHSIDNSRYQIVLFGAFSAGKSSFINAFLKEQVLPSSPNPTTAAICKIQAPIASTKHKDFSVIWKSEEELLLELQSIFELAAIKITSLEDALKRIRNGSCKQLIKNYPVQGSFLAAFEKGYELDKTTASFEDSLRTEYISCFIKEVTLYYEHPYTLQGYVFVDTPGVDSVNGRHSNVAFTYIKEADVLLYVTYYNHAFSKSDKEFILQLGRMQEEFPADKMYFLVNAIDLAKDEMEKELVENYVRRELEKLSVTDPRLYSISSHLEMKEDNRSGFSELTTHLKKYLRDEVQLQLQKKAALHYTEALEYAANVYQSSLEALNNKEEVQNRFTKEQLKIKELLTNEKVTVVAPLLQKEIEELLYYVRKRVSERLPQFFKESFYPGRLKGSYRASKEELKLALTEYTRDALFDIEQELRATTFRIENQMTHLFEAKLTDVKKQMQKISTLYQITTEEEVQFKSFVIQPYSLSEMVGTNEDLLKMYRSSKQFFELGENKLLQEELQKRMTAWIFEQFIEKQQQLFLFYNGQLQEQLISVLSEQVEQLPLQLKQYIEAITNEKEREQLAEFLRFNKEKAVVSYE